MMCGFLHCVILLVVTETELTRRMTVSIKGDLIIKLNYTEAEMKSDHKWSKQKAERRTKLTHSKWSTGTCRGSQVRNEGNAPITLTAHTEPTMINSGTGQGQTNILKQ